MQNMSHEKNYAFANIQHIESVSFITYTLDRPFYHVKIINVVDHIPSREAWRREMGNKVKYS